MSGGLTGPGGSCSLPLCLPHELPCTLSGGLGPNCVLGGEFLFMRGIERITRWASTGDLPCACGRDLRGCRNRSLLPADEAGLVCLLQSAERETKPQNGPGASGTKRACGQQNAAAAPLMNTDRGVVQHGGRGTPLGCASRMRRSTRGTGKPFGGTMNGPVSADERINAFTYPSRDLFSVVI
jgi:hypothetical protein